MSNRSWERVQVGQLLERIEAGVSPSALDHPASEHEFGVLKVSAVTSGEFKASENKALPPDFPVANLPTVQAGDLLMSRANTVELVGAVALCRTSHPNLLLSDKILRLVPNGRVTPNFLARTLRSTEVRRQIMARATGTSGSMCNISQATIREISIDLPPLPEQRRIAALLDQADGIRRKRREAIVLAESFLRSAFLEMFGDPVGNPRGWEQRSLSEVADIASGVTKGRNFGPMPTIQVPYMRVANVQDGRLDLREVKSVEILPRELERFRLLDGDVLVTEGGDPDKLGRGAVWRGQVQDCIHQNHIFRIRPDIGLLLPEYLSAQLGSSRGKRYFMRAAKQTTGIASINMSQLKAFPVLVPPVALQSKFAKVCDAADKMVDRQRAVLAETERLFEALVGDVFGGYL